MKTNKRIFALGFFDGVHLGHQALLHQCLSLGKELRCGCAAITFTQHPRSLFSPQTPGLITALEDRKSLLLRYGMEDIHVLPVTKEVMSTPWEDFLEMLLEKGAAGFVCGDDFHFGHAGAGNASLLQDFCSRKHIPCAVVAQQSLNGQRISSTYIRGCILDGRMEEAVRFLGHPHILTGTVVHGQHLGRTIGVPTANLTVPDGVAVPKLGVYICRALVDGKTIPAVANVGTRPTVSGSGITVEPWLLDFSGDLYGKQITLEFYKFLRPETRFQDLQTLQRRIRLDADEARRYFEFL